MIWGLTSGGWMSGLTAKAPDRFRAHLQLLANNDLHATEWSAKEILEAPADRRRQMADWCHELDVRVALGVHVNVFAESRHEVEASVEQALQAIDQLREPFRVPLLISGLRYTSFTRAPSVREQIERASEVLAPVAKAAANAGCPLALHNAGHYCSDLAELCRRTPGLGILFDTANPFLVGERPPRAAEAAAPYTLGTHLKDHYVWPNKQATPLCLEVKGAVLGEGDAEIRQVLQILRARAPRFNELVMLMEIDPVEGLTREAALRKCIEFIRTV